MIKKDVVALGGLDCRIQVSDRETGGKIVCRDGP